MTRTTASALLAVAIGLIGCQGPEPEPLPPIDSAEPTPADFARTFRFSWIDAASTWHLLDFAHADDSVEGAPLGWASFASYGEEFSPEVALTLDEHTQLWSLIEAAGVLARAEGQVEQGAEECCQQPGYSAAVTLQSSGSVRQGSIYWTADTETDALAPLRTYVQTLVERYAHQMPVGEYILQMSLVGGIAGDTDTLSFNVNTGAVTYVPDSGTPHECQATTSQTLAAEAILHDPVLWLLNEKEFGSASPDMKSFCLEITTGGDDRLWSCYIQGGDPVPPPAARRLSAVRKSHHAVSIGGSTHRGRNCWVQAAWPELHVSGSFTGEHVNNTV